MRKEDYKIDTELNNIMPNLTSEEQDELEKSLLKDGFKGAPIMVWKEKDIIIDGHNRYQICKKHNIPFEVKEMEFENKEEVIQWMIRAQLGRRNLIPAQRAALVKKFRPLLEEEAKKRQGKRTDLLKKDDANSVIGNTQNDIVVNLPQSTKNDYGRTSEKLASMADMSEKTYRMAEKVLDSENQELKEEMLSGKTSINAAHKELKRLEKEGRAIENPVQKVERSLEPNNSVLTQEDVETVKERLYRIKEQHEMYLKNYYDETKWLLEKDFYSDDGDELTAMIRSELNNCIEGFVMFRQLIEKFRPDDCGDESVIIVKK